VGLFCFFQLALGRLLVRIFRLTGQPFGPAFWAMALTEAFFSNFFEAPFGAIPLYLLIRLASTPAGGQPVAWCTAAPQGFVVAPSANEPTEERPGRGPPENSAL
jgi:hypothetical protein